MDITNLLIVFVAGLVASSYSVIVGGGGLITLSTMILLGIPTHVVVATTLAGILGRNIMGLLNFHHAKKVDYKLGIQLSVIFSLGAIAGTFIFLNLAEDLLNTIIAIAFVCILLFVLYKKDFGTVQQNVSRAQRIIGHILFFPLGVYASIVSTGGGFFSNFIVMHFFGKTYLESAGVRKIISAMPLVIITIIYGYNSIVYWDYAAALFISQAIGGYYGSKHALKKGDSWVRWLFVIVVIASLFKLLT